ncbi:MAG: hypothetical protein O6852_09205 [Gammaproteobacteria bacterium]|nr:hypothetical protein [Gammaproteobacteria bacterium]
MKYSSQVLVGVFTPVFILVISVIGTAHANPFSFNANSVEQSDEMILAGVVHRGRPPFKRIYKKQGSVEKVDFALLEEVSNAADENKAHKKKGTPNSFRPPFNRHAKHSNPK